MTSLQRDFLFLFVPRNCLHQHLASVSEDRIILNWSWESGILKQAACISNGFSDSVILEIIPSYEFSHDLLLLVPVHQAASANGTQVRKCLKYSKSTQCESITFLPKIFLLPECIHVSIFIDSLVDQVRRFEFEVFGGKEREKRGAFWESQQWFGRTGIDYPNLGLCRSLPSLPHCLVFFSLCICHHFGSSSHCALSSISLPLIRFCTVSELFTAHHYALVFKILKPTAASVLCLSPTAFPIIHFDVSS